MIAVVAIYDLINSQLSVETVYNVKNWKDAFEKAFPNTDFGELPEIYEEAIEYLFDQKDHDLKIMLF